MTAANRVIVNTLILYGRIVITIGLTFYTTRIILDALGSSDYGIYQLVGGVIAMLAFLKNAMATATQRFLSFYQGKNDLESQKAVFTSSLVMHIGIGLFLMLVLWGLESFLFDQFLNIDATRIFAAKMVYRAMLVSLFFGMINVPFMGSLVAHENLLFVAIINIIEAVLKLGFAFFLIYTLKDKLIVYAALMAFLSLVILALYAFFCFRRYDECTIKSPKIDKARIKEIASFAGWNLFGSICSLARTQGLAVLLNLFFGTVVNAAYGIASQVGMQVNFLSVTMLGALNPQIMKSEGSNDRPRMLRLSMMASKFGFFLVAIIAIPAIFEMENVLTFWLKEVPENTIVFAKMILVSMLIHQLTIGLQSAMQATGKIKVYQSITGVLIMLTLPLAYLFLKLGYPPYAVFLAHIFVEILASTFRIYFANRLTGLSIKQYVERVFVKEIIPLILSLAACVLLVKFVVFEYRFLITGMTSFLFLMIGIYFFGLCKDEKELLLKFYNTILNKFRK